MIEILRYGNALIPFSSMDCRECSSTADKFFVGLRNMPLSAAFLSTQLKQQRAPVREEERPQFDKQKKRIIYDGGDA